MSRGKREVSQTAMAVLGLQAALPDSKVIYASATGATEVHNLAYAPRLGLWGAGTPFPNALEFVTQIAGGGVAAMELVSRDMKQRGVYLARGLSFEGVEYNRITHVLTPDQREVYDKLASAWQVVLNNFEKALELVASKLNEGGEKVVDGRARGAAMSAFWGCQQRFWNQILCATQMPSVLADVEKQLLEGHCAVLQLVNTNEASLDRSLDAMGEEDDLADIDMTPRDQLLQLVEHCFPVTQMQQVFDQDG
jgi:hypothetical protein